MFPAVVPPWLRHRTLGRDTTFPGGHHADRGTGTANRHSTNLLLQRFRSCGPDARPEIRLLPWGGMAAPAGAGSVVPQTAVCGTGETVGDLPLLRCGRHIRVHYQGLQALTPVPVSNPRAPLPGDRRGYRRRHALPMPGNRSMLRVCRGHRREAMPLACWGDGLMLAAKAYHTDPEGNANWVTATNLHSVGPHCGRWNQLWFSQDRGSIRVVAAGGNTKCGFPPTSSCDKPSREPNSRGRATN